MAIAAKEGSRQRRNKAPAGISRRSVLISLGGIAGALAIKPARAVDQRTPGLSGIVYTADEHGHSISAIELSSRQVATVPVPIAPHNIDVTPDGSRLLAVGDPAGGAGHAHGRGPPAPGRLLVLDPHRLADGPSATIDVGEHPAHVIADREGRYAFVTLGGANAVAVVDLTSRTVLQTVPTGRYPHGLRRSPDGRHVYVANVSDGSVSVIDAREFAEVGRIRVGRTPVQVGFTPDGTRAFVSLRDENQVAVIDPATRRVVQRVRVGRNPIQLHATPDGRFLYVANQGTTAAPADTVSVIEIATGAVVATIRTGLGAHGVAVSNDGRHVFVTNIVDGTVSAIDAQARAVVATFTVGRGPNGITFRA